MEKEKDGMIEFMRENDLLGVKWEKIPKDEMDKCVFCGKETDYPKNMHIDYRMYYIEGAGQLCKECYENIYSKK